MIEVQNITKRYGEKIVVNDVSVKIAKGKVTSFIGPNGAGKSTLLSIISRLLESNSGEVFIDGQNIRRCKSNDLAKKISILKQTNHLNVRLTVRDLICFGRFPYSQGRLSTECERKVQEAIQYMGLEEIEHFYLDQLSGGQRQRAFIAMVIAQDTDYILLDEPLNNLDMKHSVQIMKMVRKLVDDLGKTVVLVLHDINFASVYSDVIVALKDGAIVKEGTVDEIIQSPVLEQVYDLPIPVTTIEGKRISVYFDAAIH